MSNHTPGPWEADTCDSPIYVQAASEFDQTTRQARMIAVIPIGDELGTYQGMGDEEAHANAALIGAAPDMLVALRTILFQVVQGCVLERDACITQARAAIAKAEGRS